MIYFPISGATKAGTHPAAETATLPVRVGEEIRMGIMWVCAFAIGCLELLFDLLIILKFGLGVKGFVELLLLEPCSCSGRGLVRHLSGACDNQSGDGHADGDGAILLHRWRVHSVIAGNTAIKEASHQKTHNCGK